jgi:hypothetical protein
MTGATTGYARSMPALGFDPAPGDVGSTIALARRYAEVAAEVTAAGNQVAGIDLTRWVGKAAAVARARQSALAQALAQAVDSSTKLSEAAASWAARLTSYQAEADALERQAAAEIANQQYLASRAPRIPELSSDLAESATALSAIRMQAGQLHQEYLAAAAGILTQFDLKAWWESTDPYRTGLEAALSPLDLLTADRWISILTKIATHPARLLEPVDEMLAVAARLMADGASLGETRSAFARTAAAIERAGTERDAMAAFEPSSVQLAERAAPGIEWAGRALGGLGLVADVGTLISPQDTGAVGWVDRGAATVNGGFLTADLLGADAVLDVIPGVGEVAIAATGVYLAGDFLYHHRAQLRDAADAAGHIIVSTADDNEHAAVRVADDAEHAARAAWDSTVGSLF